MNNKQSILYLFLIITPFFFGCRGPVKEGNDNNAPAGSASSGQKYSIDTKASVVSWKGSMQIGANSHTGYVEISKGELMVDNGELTGGTVEVDMNTITDENHDSGSGLVNHLKDPDFFDVEKFPVATIVLTKVASIHGDNKRITGDLTIKGITQPVTFLSKVDVKDGAVKMDGQLVIDRTKWDVRYKSGKFYDLLADQTISDFIAFEVKIVAKE